jgi:hypothetical protein
MIPTDASRRQPKKVLDTISSVSHSFEGKLGQTIEVHGDFLPRQIFGKMTALCAILRMIYVSLATLSTEFKPDVVIIDGVSFPIPLLKVLILATLLMSR